MGGEVFGKNPELRVEVARGSGRGGGGVRGMRESLGQQKEKGWRGLRRGRKKSEKRPRESGGQPGVGVEGLEGRGARQRGQGTRRA